jgi:branched-chain amino acid transport system substrate-binding protein
MDKEITRRQLVGRGMALLALPAVAALLEACGSGGGATTAATGTSGSAGKAPAAAATKEIVIGALLPLTGPNSGWGQRTSRGLQTAAKLIEQAGGVKALGGATITIKVYDTQSQPDVAGNVAQKAIQDGVVALTGCNQSPATLIASQVAERQGIPFVTASDYAPQLTTRGFKYMFQTDPAQSEHVKDMLTFCQAMGQKTGVHVSKLGLLCDNTDVGKGIAQFFTQFAPQFNLPIVANESYPLSTTDFSPYIAKMKQAGVDLLLGFQTPQPAVLIVRAMKQQHFDPIAFGGLLGGQVSNDYVNALGADADYTLCSSPWGADLKIQGNAEAQAAYKSQWNEDMDDTSAAGFAAAAVYWDALERAGSTDPGKLRDAVAATNLDPGDRNYIDLAGCKFDDKGYNTRAAVDIKQIKDKAWHSVWPSQYASDFQVVWPKPKWTA